MNSSHVDLSRFGKRNEGNMVFASHKTVHRVVHVLSDVLLEEVTLEIDLIYF